MADPGYFWVEGDFIHYIDASGVEQVVEKLSHANVDKTGTYTTTALDGTVNASASGGAFTITLVTAVGNRGLRQTFIKTDSSGNIVTIDGNSSETINGATTYALNNQYDVIVIESDNANWLIVG